MFSDGRTSSHVHDGIRFDIIVAETWGIVEEGSASAEIHICIGEKETVGILRSAEAICQILPLADYMTYKA